MIRSKDTIFFDDGKTTSFEGREGLIILSEKGTILEANTTARRLLSETTAPSTWTSFVDLPRFYSFESNTDLQLDKLLFNTNKKGFENEVAGWKNKSEELKWLSISAQWIEADRVLVSLFDISTLIETKFQKSEKERHLALIVATLDDIIFEIEDSGFIFNCWTNAQNKLFFPMEKMIGNTVEKLFPTELSDLFLDEIDKAIKGRVSRTVEYMSPFESHENTWYRLYINPIPSYINRAVARITDITTEVLHKEWQRINEQKFDQAFHHSAIGMAVTDENGKCIDANTSLCIMTGYTLEEFKARTFGHYCHPEDTEYHRKILQKFLNHEIEVNQCEKRFIAKNGQYKWYLMTSTAIFDKNDTIRFIISQFQDLSVFKSNISKLEKQKNQLEIATVELETRLAQLEEFSQIVAHNLKGPAGNIQMLIQEIDHVKNSPDLEEYLRLLKLSSTGLTNILQELVKILEIKENKLISYEDCLISDKIKVVKDQLVTEIVNKDASFTTDLQEDRIYFPSIYLESILYNLLSNALKYVDKGVKPKIHIASRLEESKMYISIHDNGIGIDLEKHQSQLFKFKKIFHRGYESNGIGLFITRHQIESLGGTIHVISTPGEGSTFTVCTPIIKK